VVTYVLAAPGAGKTTVAEPLRALMPTHAVIDWDALMVPASTLVGRDVRSARETWPAYTAIVRAVIESLPNLSVVVLGVATPDELPGWPVDRWLLLDCSDEERRRRVGDRLTNDDIEDARRYRTLGLPTVDSTGRTPDDVAEELARHVLTGETR
jgi:broad-specificity NMP kinase